MLFIWDFEHETFICYIASLQKKAKHTRHTSYTSQDAIDAFSPASEARRKRIVEKSAMGSLTVNISNAENEVCHILHALDRKAMNGRSSKWSEPNAGPLNGN